MWKWTWWPDAIVHSHNEGDPCTSRCMTRREWKIEQRALRAANVGKHRR